MPESDKHILLVNLLRESIMSIIPSDQSSVLEIDSSSTDKPYAVINGFIPDAFFDFDNITIIGEAKTDADFQRKHSLAQYDAYMDTLDHEYENGKKVYLFVAVSWQICNHAYNFFKSLKKKKGSNCRIIIISDNKKRYEL